MLLSVSVEMSVTNIYKQRRDYLSSCLYMESRLFETSVLIGSKVQMNEETSKQKKNKKE